MLRPGFTGNGTITITLAGAEHRLEGAECGLKQFPDGTHAYAFNVGTPSVGDGGPDYFGLVVELASDQPDGTYDDVLAVGSLAGKGFSFHDVSLTIGEGGASGSLTAKEGTATFTC